jgi:sugar lactone lactonase YvrE
METRQRPAGYLAIASAAAFCLVAAPLSGWSQPLAPTAHFVGVQTPFSTSTSLCHAAGVAADGSGNVYISDDCNNVVLKETPSGGSNVETMVVNASSSGESYFLPVAVAADAAGDVYVLDAGDNVVLKETPSGNSYTQSLVPTGELNNPSGIAVDASGNVYIADTNNGKVLKETLSSGTYTESAVASGLGGPFGLAVDASGNLYISDEYDGKVWEETWSSGSYSQSEIEQVSEPLGIAVDQYGNVYVTDYVLLNVTEAKPAGAGSFTFSTVTSFPALSPAGIAVDWNENIYFADDYTDQVWQVSQTGANFYRQNVGSASSSELAIFRFDSAGELGSTAVVTEGAAGLDFSSASGGNCASLQPYNTGDLCDMSVDFAPTLSGPRHGAAELLDRGGNVLAAGNLQGTGVAPMVNFAPGTTVPLASVSNPPSVAVDASGNLYIASPATDAVYKETLSGGSYTQSTIMSSSTGLADPWGIAVDGAGNVYVADVDESAVFKASPSLGGYNVTTVANQASNGLSSSMGVAVDGSGNVYIADINNARVLKETLLDGIYVQSVVANSSNGLISPAAVAVDGSGNVYIADDSTNAVYKETLQAGSYSQTTLAAGLAGALGVTVDGAGDVYLSNTFNGQVLKETPSGGGYTESAVTVSNLSTPFGLAADGYGDLYIADPSNNNVVEVNFASGPSLTFAATPTDTYSSDSPQVVTVENVGNATLAFPPSVANPVLSANFFFSNQGANDCLRTIQGTPPGTLAPGGSCILPVNFDPGPLSLGAVSGTLVLADNSLNVNYATQTLTLNGTGVAPVPPTLNQPSGCSTTPTPPNGTICTLSGSSATFSWTTGSGITSYELWLSSVNFGSNDAFNSGAITGTSVAVPTIPTNGATLFATLRYHMNGTWLSADYAYTEAGTPAPPVLTSPSASPLSGSNLTFTWTSGTGVTDYELWLSALSAGGNDLYNSGVIAPNGNPTVSLTPPSGVPTKGVNLYVTLRYHLNGTWQTANYLFTEAGTSAPPAIQSVIPCAAPGVPCTLQSSTETFTWSTGTGAVAYELWLGSSVGGHDVYNSGASTNTSAIATGIPQNGVNLYATLLYRMNATWLTVPYVFTEAGTAAAPVLTTPVPCSSATPTLACQLTNSPGSPSVAFSWSAGTGPTAFQFLLGTAAPGSSNVYNSGVIAASTTTVIAPSVPTNGVYIYARLLWRTNGVWQHADYSYLEAGTPSQGSLYSPAPCTTVTPTSSCVLPGASATFQWNAGTGVSAYEVYVGTKGKGSSSIFNSGVLTGLQVTVSNLPTNGSTVYVRLYSKIDGAWQFTDYTYEAQ